MLIFHLKSKVGNNITDYLPKTNYLIQHLETKQQIELDRLFENQIAKINDQTKE